MKKGLRFSYFIFLVVFVCALFLMYNSIFAQLTFLGSSSFSNPFFSYNPSLQGTGYVGGFSSYSPIGSSYQYGLSGGYNPQYGSLYGQTNVFSGFGSPYGFSGYNNPTGYNNPIVYNNPIGYNNPAGFSYGSGYQSPLYAGGYGFGTPFPLFPSQPQYTNPGYYGQNLSPYPYPYGPNPYSQNLSPYGPSPYPTSQLPEADITVNATNDDDSIELEVNEILCIDLEANPTTGYSWGLDPNSADDAVVNRLLNQFFPNSYALGAGGTEKWYFEAIGTGQTSIILEYRQPWVAQAVETFTITVNVP